MECKVNSCVLRFLLILNFISDVCPNVAEISELFMINYYKFNEFELYISADPCEPCQNIPGPNVGSAPSGSSSGKRWIIIWIRSNEDKNKIWTFWKCYG